MRRDPPTAPPRRQARGHRRMKQLLRAAGEVFAEVGYERATTNAIAAKAGVSPGTLYQFFPNKQALAEALASQYAQQNAAVHELAFDFDPSGVSLRELISRTVDPFLAFRQNAPGYDALFMGTAVSTELSERVLALHEGLKQRLAKLMLARCSYMRPAVVQRCAEVSVQIVKGLLPLTLHGSPEQIRTGASEMKLVLERYLSPIIEKSKNSRTRRSAKKRLRSNQ
jgi:AcrR family transcriptional regulator